MATGRVLVVDPSVAMKRVIDEVLHRKAKLFEDDLPTAPKGLDYHGHRCSVVYASPRPAHAVLSCRRNNGFLAAFMMAYNHHLRLRLSPDVLWLTIVQAVSQWVATDPGRAERYRHIFVKHAGVVCLDVVAPPETSWAQVLQQFQEVATRHTTPGIVDAFAPRFSTTTAVSEAACAVTALHTVKAFFKYNMSTTCGIGEVILEGDAADWVALRARTSNLREVLQDVGKVLASWFARLDVTLAELEGTAGGHHAPRVDFWSRAFSHHTPRASGAETELSGWVLHFFGASETPKESVPLSKLPTGYVTVPFVRDGTEGTQLCAGVWSTHVDGDGAVFCEPQWAVLQ
jgi:hypothetical protein